MADYDFSTLSPTDFELLVRDLLEAEHGWKLEAFGHGRDGGIDLRMSRRGNRTIVQCKHYVGSTFAQLRSSLKAEKQKMAKEKPTRYLVATTKSLSRTQKDTLAQDLAPLLNETDDLLQRIDLNHLIEQHPDVERQHFKLWLASSEVLSTIVNSGIWARSEALLEDIEKRVQLYVTNPSYARAAKGLSKNRVLVIVGSPGVGKSLLAEMLLLTHWKDGWQVVQVGSNIQDAWDVWAPKGKQIFLYDDFLGQTSFAEKLAKNEDAHIVRFADMVSTRPDRRFILTTRTQVLRQAEDQHEPLKRANFDLRSCVVKVTDYSRIIKARILYNHLYFSTLPRKLIRDYVRREKYWSVIDHPNYRPRIVEQVLKQAYTKAADLDKALLDALDDPVQLWGPSFENGLSDVSRRILLSLATFPPEGARTEVIHTLVTGFGSSRVVGQALKVIEGTWIVILAMGATQTLAFADPSCRDYVLSYLNTYPDELIEVLDSAVTLNQVVLILRYAVSLSGEARKKDHKFAGMTSALIAHPEVLRSALERVYVQETQTATGKRSLVNALASIIRARDVLWTGSTRWVVSKLEELATLTSKYDNPGDATSLKSIVEFLLKAKEETPELKDQIHELLLEVGWYFSEAIETEDDYDSFINVFEWGDGDLMGDDAFANATSMIVSRLEVEAEDLISNLNDPDEMRTALEELETYAEGHQIRERLASAFSFAAEKIEEFTNFEPDPEDLTPSGPEEAFERPASSRVSTTRHNAQERENHEITSMFTQLT